MCRSAALFIVAPVLWGLAGCADTKNLSKADDLRLARALFERNIEAIQKKDKEAYLGCYRRDQGLVRAGPDGLKTGYAELATNTPTTASDKWPESLEAKTMDLHWIAPGVVYGIYEYRVVIEGKATEGQSERLFMRRGDRWQIEVTTAFPTVPPPDKE